MSKVEVVDEADSKKSIGVSLKRMLACLGITALLFFMAFQISVARRDSVRASCLERFGNVNAALTLYRADFDGFSPMYSRLEISKYGAKLENKLEKYASGKLLACPYDQGLPVMASRMIAGSRLDAIVKRTTIYVPFGVEDGSVIMTCENHLVHKFRFEVPISVWRTQEQDPPTGGKFNVLLRNGTARSIPFSTKMEHWICRLGEFKRLEDRPNSWTGFGNIYIFDFEPKPPQFEY